MNPCSGQFRRKNICVKPARNRVRIQKSLGRAPCVLLGKSDGAAKIKNGCGTIPFGKTVQVSLTNVRAVFHQGRKSRYLQYIRITRAPLERLLGELQRMKLW